MAALAIGWAILFGAPDAGAREDPPLVKLASLYFPNLTPAELALLVFADKNNLARGPFAIAGTSAEPLDPSNDPAHADEWAHARDVRAELIRWLAVDNEASLRVDPNGVRLLGAHVSGMIDLTNVRVPFGLTLARCSIPGGIDLRSAELRNIDLGGSHSGPIEAANVVVHGDAFFGCYPWIDCGGFEASGLVDLSAAKIAGIASFSGAHLRYSEAGSSPFTKPLKMSLLVTSAEIGGDLALTSGFESKGCAAAVENTIGGDLNLTGAHFINPGNVALAAGANDVKGSVFLGSHPVAGGTSAVDGLAMFERLKVGNAFIVNKTRFGGKFSESHGFVAPQMSVGREFIWSNAILADGGILDLSGAHLGALLDEAPSWPAPTKLLIDGLTYESIGGGTLLYPTLRSPVDASSRLRWLALQPGFYSQPYRQLAKVLADKGDEVGATRVLITKEDLRYAQFGALGRLWGGLLRDTVGYGHQPLLTIMWSLLVVLLGWMVVQTAKAASLMRPTYPENAPAGSDRRYERLYPLLYSLDVFLPFVNLHQEHYWWPDADASGRCRVLGATVTCRGSFVLYYLWAQIIAGWILSAIFVAGVTGLIKGD